jgi:DNA-binding CsgD family transcriptional regulator
MTHCRLTILRLVTAIAQPLGLDAKAFCREHSLDLDSPHPADARVPWQTFAALLQLTQNSVGGAAGLEAVGVNTCQGFRLYRQLADLYFGLEDLYQITVSRIIPEMYGSILRSSFRRQADSSFRVTLSIEREGGSCYPFWTLMLGQFRALPRHLQLPDAAVDVEFGDHFGEFIIVPPNSNDEEHGPASKIRRGVRDHLLDDLLLHDASEHTDKLRAKSLELETRTVVHRNISCDPVALQQLLSAITTDLNVPTARLWAYSSDGLLPIGDHGESTNRARLRRTLWINSRPVGCIEVERESSGDPSAINAELDEHAATYVERIAQLVGSTPRIADAKFSSGTAAVVNEPPIAEPPPSSRGRMRAARNSRVGEIASLWRLTPRQASVMALLVEGLANKEIALRLGCSVGTIENHVTCILRRAKVGSRGALTAAFWGRGN